MNTSTHLSNSPFSTRFSTRGLPQTAQPSAGARREGLSARTRSALTFALLPVLLCALLLGASGCGSGQAAEGVPAGSDGSTAPAPESVVVVVGNHANAPRVNRYPALVELLDTAARTRGYVAFVCVDGKPFVFDGGGAIVGSDAPTQRVRDDENAVWTGGLLDLMDTEVRALTPESDPLEALRLATRALESAPEGQRHIVMADSGLATCGPVTFTQEGMLFAYPEDVAGYLAGIQALVEFAPGTTIDWFGIGDVAEPQPTLTNRQRENLRDIWEAVIMRGGGTVTFHDDAPASATAASGAGGTGGAAAAGSAAGGNALPPVSVVEIEPDPLPELIEADEPVFLGEDVLHFVPNYADLIDPEQARQTLRPFADYLAEHPDLYLHVIGTTAEGGWLATDDESVKASYDLSWSRAGVVKELLVELGAPEAQVIPEGQGFFDRWHEPEIDENGNYLPDAAARNRKVVLIPATTPHDCVL